MSKSILSAALVAVAAIGGCTADTVAPDTNGLSETAETTILTGGPEQIYATINIANGSSTTQSFSWTNGCNGLGAIRIRAYKTNGSDTTLAWDSAKLSQIPLCPPALMQRTLNPGDAFAIHETVAASTILGDSLAAGQYVLTLTAATNPALPVELATPSLMVIDAVVDPPGVNLNGTWEGTTHGVNITLALTWTPDSVKGVGAYFASQDNVLGCGGGTLRGSGTLTFAAARSPGEFVGHATFDNGWTPPYHGTIVDGNTISGAFMSVDQGPCACVLSRDP